MNQSNRKRQYIDQQENEANSEWSFNFEEDNNGTNIGNSTGNELREMTLKMAALESKNALLEAKNQILEGKLENLELKAQNRALMEEGELNKLKEENKAICQKMKEAESQAKIEKNELTEKMAQIEVDFLKKLAILEGQQKNSLDSVKEENKTILEKLKGVEQNAQIANDELAQKVKVDFGKKLTSIEKQQKNSLDKKMNEFTKKLTSLKEQHLKEIAELKLESSIQINQHDIGNFGKEMAILIKQQREAINWEQFKPDALWTHLAKGKRLENARGNRWNGAKTKATISEDGLQANNQNEDEWQYIFAEQEFCISWNSRRDHFPGTIIYYFEVTKLTASSKTGVYVGLSNGKISDNEFVEVSPNCYTFFSTDNCFMSGNKHPFEWPTGAIKPKWNGIGDVRGCGLLLNSANELSIFFTGNGILLGKQMPIHPDNFLTPTIKMMDSSVEANFEHDLAKPFKYNIEKCPGMVFE